MKTTRTIALATALMFAWQGVWADGDSKIPGLTLNGSGYYEIPNAAALNALATYVNAGNSCIGLEFKVTAESEITVGDEFTPIGIGNYEYDGTPFEGTFDGSGITISGINYTNEEGVGIGLFGYICQPAKISNIVLDNCSFIGNYQVGAIVGSVYGSAEDWGIFNCIVKNVTVEAVKATIAGEVYPGSYAGGIIGYCSCLTVKDCYSEATVTGDQYVGAIAGYLMGSEAREGIIEDCYYTNNNKVVGGRGTEDEMVADATNGILKITLFDKDDDDIKNETRLANYDSQVCNVTLSGRTLYKDDKWNTLCLPFDLTINGSVLNGATVKELVSSEYSKGSLTLNFTEDGSDLTAIEAGKPYIIKWKDGNNLTDPVFESVTIKGTTAGDKTTDWVDFVATYSPEAIYENSEDKTCLYLGADNTLYYPSSEDVKVNSFRAYFKLKNDLTVGETPSEEPGNPETTSNSIKAFVLNFGDEETGIREISTPSNSSNSSNLWFTLDGRRLNGQPTQSGIFIHGGKKVILP